MRTTNETATEYRTAKNAALASKPERRPTADEAARRENKERQSTADRNRRLDARAKEIQKENPKLPYAAALIEAAKEIG